MKSTNQEWKTYDQGYWIVALPQSTGTYSQELRGTRLNQVSNDGQVRIVYLNHDNEIMKIKTVNQHWKGKTVKYLGIPAGPYVHRLVAQAFIDNPNSHRFVIHLDGDLENNQVDNLAWTDTARPRIDKNK